MSNNIKIVVVLDESGSMQTLLGSTRESFDGFINSQQQLDGDASFVLYKFGSKITSNSFESIHNVKKLEDMDYRPSGGTPLFDAIGKAINTEVTLGSSGVLAIITDGEENQSLFFNKEMVSNLIDQIQKVNGWQVLFLGANIKDFSDLAKSLNVSKNNALNFMATDKGIHEGYASITASVTSYRQSHA
ncbi:vWA domain-containing protein [uncultured Flavobacterium sp.]|uniref:vWA domain-containing protein n=1 Tax=uncultured Flavobacterium sp. TaxID=165435 RepID=UPI002599D391|nr:vWA domain-containing protein [uncultured Flavobacterium sp.]